MKLLIALLSFPLSVLAVTPPPPVTPTLAKVLYSWTPPTTRADGAALLAADRKETRIYITSLTDVIKVAEPATSYTYTVPAGQCLRKADGAVATTVDTAGLESAASNTVMLSEDACSPKWMSLPKAPGSVTATIVK